MADPLAPYRARRDFARTAEPPGDAPPRAGGHSFVVQKHDATRLHYDFRLELGGVLKSRAVTRGPSLDPADKRLAVEVEDHPLDYGSFEGPIASGYGAGTVLLWDRGTWEPASENPAADLAKGRLAFTLHGGRLRGAWRLVRMKPRPRETKPAWLLVKDDDAEARPGDADALLDADTSVVTGRTLEAIAGRPAKPPPKRPAPKPRGPAAPKPPKDDSPPITVEGVRVTHPGKLLWPADGGEDGITKRDLAAYLVAVAPRLLPWIAGRPLSLLSVPDGIGGERFFLRHAARNTSPHLARVTPRGETSPLLEANDVAALVSLAQFNILEVHPWPALSRRIASPDRLVLDLDPDEALPFAEVVRAAHLCRERLAAMGLTPFCKTTGGKGLHVAAPVTGATFPRLLAVAKTLCAAMTKDAPDRFTVDVSKAERAGRIYLDYGRNAREASAVAAWSPRARPGAPVSVPLSWDEVTEALSPRALTIRTAPARLSLPDPWSDFDAAAAALPTARRAARG